MTKDILIKNLRKNASFYGAAAFLLINAVFFALSFETGTDRLASSVGFLQLFLLLFLIHSVLPGKASLPISIVILSAYYFLVCYISVVGAPLDLLLVVRRWQEFAFLGRSYAWLIFLLLAAAFASSWVISSVKNIQPRARAALLFVFIGIAPFSSNELFSFIGQAARSNQGIEFYQGRIYEKLVNESIGAAAEPFETGSSQIATATPNHIVMLQLESFNARLISATTTPNFLDIASQGYYFPEFYSNSVQTILAQENILCSLPSSFLKDLVSTGRSSSVQCLPKLLKPLGFESAFFASSHLEFEETGKFMSDIGFDQIHGYDTWRQGDPEFMWGRQEDVFLERTFDYLKADGKKDRSLAYITFEATNHWPFDNAGIGKDSEVKFSNRLSASMSKQDGYLAGLLNRLDKLYPEKDYVLFVFGDHSWPAALQSDNSFNQRGALDENFRTSMAVYFGNREARGRTINNRYSHMDTMPTIMELLGRQLPSNRFRGSYAQELTMPDSVRGGGDVLLIQPYSDRFIVLMKNDGRYSLNLKKGELSKTLDPTALESKEEVVASGLGDSINLFSNLIK